MTNEDAKSIYDRLRATEQETSSQSVKIDAMSKRLDETMARMDKHLDNLWRVLGYLIAALVALALGPKAIDKFASSINGGVASVQSDIAPWHGDRTTFKV